MKILFITRLFLFPLDSGGKIKTYNILKYLSNYHEITLLSLLYHENELKYKRLIDKYCKEVKIVLIKNSPFRDIYCFILSMLTRKPFLIRRDYSKKMQDEIDSAIKKDNFDLIYVDDLSMSQYVNSKFTKILDEHNVEWNVIQRYFKIESNLFKKMAALIEYKKVRSYEIKKCKEFDIVFTVTGRDRDILSKAGLKNIFSLPIGVDTKELKPLRKNSIPRSIVFLGAISWPPYVDAIRWFSKQIFPVIKQNFSDIKFVIIGKRPPRVIRRLAKDKNIKLLDSVDDPAEYLKDCAAFIVPLRIAGGMRVKILNAMAWGIPVVSTTVGAEGIDVKDNKDILIRDNPKEFAEAVMALINNKDLSDGLCKNARILAETTYDWDNSFRKLELFLAKSRAPVIQKPRDK